MEKSLKQIIYETNVLVDAHIQLRSFYYGDLLDIIKIGSIDYASCFLSINSASNNANFETFNLELFVFDILASDDSNRTDIENTTKRILNDLITTIRYSNRWNDFSEVLTDVSELKYYDKLQDRVSGWGCTIQLKVYRNDCLVGLPIDDYDFDMSGNFEATVFAIVKNTDNDILATKLVSDSDDTIIVPDITVTDSDGSTYQQASGTNVVCTAGGGSGDVTVNGNAFGTYTAPTTFEIGLFDGEGNPYLGFDLVSPDIYIYPIAINVNGVQIAEVLQGSFSLDVIDRGGNQIGSLDGIDWIVPISNTSSLTKTGQTTSYAANDDGDLERGRDVSFFVLDHNNPFGNTDRFTDTLGTQIYADNIIIDWSQWQQEDKLVQGYALSANSSTSGTQNWANWMSNTPYTVGAFGDWVVANYNEFVAILNHETDIQTNYTPFNNTLNLWTNTTRKNSTTRAFYFTNTGAAMAEIGKTNVFRALLVRTFTLAELGL